MSIPLPISVALEQLINRALKMDPETRERLDGVNGKVVQIVVTSPIPSTATFLITDREVHVSGQHDGEVDTTITGSLSSLRSLMKSNDAVHQGEATIEGDIGTANTLKDIADALDIDWEEQISPFVGDTVAHQLGVASRTFASWFDRTSQSMKANTREYLEEEVELVVPANMLKVFNDAVDNAQSTMDRLEARLKRLEGLKNSDNSIVKPSSSDDDEANRS